jgi:Tfp pilus assembly ATPase PilU
MSQGEGMQTLDQSLLKLYRQGLIDYETAKPFIQDRSTHDQFRSYNPR